MSEKTFSLKFNVPILKIDYLTANFSNAQVKNENIKLFDGVYETIGPVSVLTLYNIERNIEPFYKIANQINILVNLNIPNMAKLFGIIVDKEKFCLIFERVTCSLQEKITLRSLEDRDKYRIIVEVMEVLLYLHDNEMRSYDLRPSNIFLNEQLDVRFIFPLENVHLFRDEKTEHEEEEILEKLLNNEDYLLRYTPPESHTLPSYSGNANDIWMLGCLIVEIFSKSRIWEGYSESEIIKQLKIQQIPKIPTDIPQQKWGMICECLNPFYKARIDIKDVIQRLYYLLVKLGYHDLVSRLQNHQILAAYLPINANNISMNSQLNQSNLNDDPYAIRKCNYHPQKKSIFFN